MGIASSRRAPASKDASSPPGPLKADRVQGPSPSHLYLVWAFRHGCSEGIWTTAHSSAAAIQKILQHGGLIGQMLDDAEEIIETDVVVLGNYRSGVEKGYRHTFSNIEPNKPNMAFIGAINYEEIERQRAAANAARVRKERELQLQIKAVAHLTKEVVLIEELPVRWRGRVRQTPKGCWNWKAAAKGPYKNVYLELKGPVPKGAVLRHSCNNRRCVNPNHLTLGSQLDNVRDMVAGHRHRSQYGKRRKNH